MATGFEHYREAERLVDDHPQQAQVHALLALVFATYDYDWNHADEVTK